MQQTSTQQLNVSEKEAHQQMLNKRGRVYLKRYEFPDAGSDQLANDQLKWNSSLRYSGKLFSS